MLDSWKPKKSFESKLFSDISLLIVLWFFVWGLETRMLLSALKVVVTCFQERKLYTVVIDPHGQHKASTTTTHNRFRQYYTLPILRQVVLGRLTRHPSWKSGFHCMTLAAVECLTYNNVWSFYCYFRFLVVSSLGYLPGTPTKFFIIYRLRPEYTR